MRQSGLEFMILGICGFCKKEFKKREKKYKFCSLICSSNFNKNGINKVTLPDYSISLAEFIGICLGDGFVSKFQIGITLNTIADKDYIPYVKFLSSHLFPGATVSLLKRTNNNALDVRISSVIAADFLRNMGIIPNNKFVPKWILSNWEYRKACIKGLFDTEGSISFKTYVSKRGLNLYKQLNFRNANSQLMQFVRDSLVYLGLKPTMTLKRSLYLSNHQSIKIFRNIIGFSNPKLLERSKISKIEEYTSWKNI